jgi:hypothetical protein
MSVKVILSSLVALSFAASLAGDAEAATRRHKKRLQVSQYSQPYVGGYYEHRLEAVPFGSQQWWSVYDRQRGRR